MYDLMICESDIASYFDALIVIVYLNIALDFLIDQSVVKSVSEAVIERW